MNSIEFTDPAANRLRFINRRSRGAIHEFFVRSSSASPMLGEREAHWHVLSSGKRTTLFKFLFLKWLWDELTSQEMKYVLSLPEFFSSDEFIACVRTLASGVSKKKIRTRLNAYRTLRGLPPLSQEKYIGMRRLEYNLSEVALSAPAAVKYSGWTRHHKDHGSLRPASIVMETRPFEVRDVGIDLFIILSVGKVVLLGTELNLSPDDDLTKSKRKTL